MKKKLHTKNVLFILRLVGFLLIVVSVVTFTESGMWHPKQGSVLIDRCS